MSLCNTNIKYVCTQNHPLQERLVWRIIFHAVRPFGRCVGGVDTCAGSRVLAHPGAAAFLFFKQSIAQCAPLYKPFRQKSPKYRHGVAHGPGGRVRAPRPTDNMAAGESGPSGTPAPTDALLVMRWGGPMYRHRPLRKRILWCVGEGLSCPPSCQPTDGHCRARQSGHFLETGSLHPPLAALRRFPRPRATARVAPTKRQGMRCKPGFGSSGRPTPTHRLPIELRREGVLAGVTDCHGRFAPSQ